MAFPTTSLLDDFNRANADPISGTWTTPIGLSGGAGAIEIVSNQVAGRAGDGMWDLTTYGPDLEAWFTMVDKPGNGLGGIFAYGRMSTLTNTANGYSVDFRVTGGTDTIRIIRYDAGSGTVLDSTGQTFNAGDGIGLEIIGSTIKMYRRDTGVWGEVFSFVDATYSAAGYIGLGKLPDSTAQDDFGGGTIGVPAVIAWTVA